MNCWYCYWGWPEAVATIYQDALRELGGDDRPLNYGPAHVVWEDENFDDAEGCLISFDKYRYDYSDEELAVVRRSLERLVALPESERCVEPEDYDGEHPDNYPPPIGIKMVKCWWLT